MKELSVLPGRVRFKSNKAYRNKDLAKYIDIYAENLYGVEYSKVNYNTGTILVVYDETKTNFKLIKSAIQQILSSKINYNAEVYEYYGLYYNTKKRKERAKTKFVWSSLVYLFFKIKHFIFGSFFLSGSVAILEIASLVTIIGGYPFIKSIYNKFTKRIHPHPDLLLRSVGLALTILRESTEGIFLIVLIDFTDYIKVSADLKCERLLKNSIKRPPNTTWIETSDGDEMLTSVQSLELGDIIFIHKGEVIPVEGEVVEGKAIVNNFYYTGQPFVSYMGEGNKVNEGIIIVSGELKVRVQKLPKVINKTDFPFDKLHLNEKVVKYQDRVVPIAIILSALNYIVTGDILNALSIILVLCPASSELVLSTGIKNYIYLLSKYNMYLKNPNTFEKIVNMNSIIFDKTGTLTHKNMEIVFVESFNKNYTIEDLLKICVACEYDNYHPIVNTLQSKLKENDLNKLESNVEKSPLLPSKGINSIYDNHKVLIGNLEFLRNNNIALDKVLDKYLYYENNLYTPILVSIDNLPAGIIVMKETIREHAKNLIDKLKFNGISNISLLTGDQYNKGRYISEKLGISNTYGDCDSEEKLSIILEQKSHGPVMMVGDGINDGLAMRAADVSISFSNYSSDNIKLNSDCIIFEEDINKLNDLIMLSKTVYKKIDENIRITNLYNVIFGVLTFFGRFDIFAAKSIDTLHSIFVLILNERIKWIYPYKNLDNK